MWKKGIFALILTILSVTGCSKDIHMVYQVQEGDTIQTIAQKFNTTEDKLVKLNKSVGFSVGERIKVE
jgi:LysM repeat protein